MKKHQNFHLATLAVFFLLAVEGGFPRNVGNFSTLSSTLPVHCCAAEHRRRTQQMNVVPASSMALCRSEPSSTSCMREFPPTSGKFPQSDELLWRKSHRLFYIVLNYTVLECFRVCFRVCSWTCSSQKTLYTRFPRRPTLTFAHKIRSPKVFHEMHGNNYAEVKMPLSFGIHASRLWKYAKCFGKSNK